MEDYDYFLDILMEDEMMIASKAKLICQEMCVIVDKNSNDYKMFWLKSDKFQIGIKPQGNPKNIKEKQIMTKDKDIVTIGFLF